MRQGVLDCSTALQPQVQGARMPQMTQSKSTNPKSFRTGTHLHNHRKHSAWTGACSTAGQTPPREGLTNVTLRRRRAAEAAPWLPACCRRNLAHEPYQPWWPANIESPTLYFHLKRCSMAYQIQEQAQLGGGYR